MSQNKKKMCFGVIIGTRAYFNSELARDVKKQLLKTLDDLGYDYVILPEDATPTGSSSIETREDGLKCAELFRQNRHITPNTVCRGFGGRSSKSVLYGRL